MTTCIQCREDFTGPENHIICPSCNESLGASSRKGKYTSIGDHLGPVTIKPELRICKSCQGTYETTNRWAYLCDACEDRVKGQEPPPIPPDPDVNRRLQEVDGKLAQYGTRLYEMKTLSEVSLTYYQIPPVGSLDGRHTPYYIAHGYLSTWPNPVALCLTGGVGVGKTGLAASIAREVMMKGDLIQYLRWPHFINRWKTAPDNAEFDRREIEPLMGMPLLVLDEIGREDMTDHQRQRFEALLDRRYIDRAPTILCSNLVGDALWNHVGEALTSRLHDWCDGGREVYELEGPDRRMEALENE
jgi:hypothetical protein